jgi:pyruvate kinase
VADAFLTREGWARPGESVVVVAALPLGQKKQTNTLRFHTVRT